MDAAMAILFPGQGSQEPGMGRDAAEALPQAMELWKKAERACGAPLREIYWESGDEGLMADTGNLQPALTVTNLSLWLALASRVRPACAAGHSLGEYSALAAAGVLAIDDLLGLVCLRGRLMAEADPEGRGGMAAVLKLSRAEAEELAAGVAAATGETLCVANYNTPAQFVISGAKAAIAAALAAVRERRGKAVPLAVSGAFHTPLLDAAAREFAGALRPLTWRAPRFAVYSNVTGAAVTDGESLRELAARQMNSAVLWMDVIAGQYRAGVRHWVEVGPGGRLSRMIAPILAPFLAPILPPAGEPGKAGDPPGTDAPRVDSLTCMEAVRAYAA
jgi:[acyl-carrier-protein] S-malonyltransferase